MILALKILLALSFICAALIFLTETMKPRIVIVPVVTLPASEGTYFRAAWPLIQDANGEVFIHAGSVCVKVDGSP